MVTIAFDKYHGNGNDFIFISCEHLTLFPRITDLRKFVVSLCKRNFSVGADGVIFFQLPLQNDSNCNPKILIVNSDGSFAGTCGNALRCLGLKLLRESLWRGDSCLNVERLCLRQFVEFQREDIAQDEIFVANKNVFAIIKNAFNTAYTYTDVSVSVGNSSDIFLPQFLKPITFTVPSSQKKVLISSITNIFVHLANPH